jgi:hypothetical protein
MQQDTVLQTNKCVCSHTAHSKGIRKLISMLKNTCKSDITVLILSCEFFNFITVLDSRLEKQKL